MSLATALRMIAAILIIAVAIQYSIYNQFLVKTIVVAHILFILSLINQRHNQRIAIISLGLAIVTPISVWRMVETGSATQGFFMLNIVAFLFIAYAAFQELTKK